MFILGQTYRGTIHVDYHDGSGMGICCICIWSSDSTAMGYDFNPIVPLDILWILYGIPSLASRLSSGQLIQALSQPWEVALLWVRDMVGLGGNHLDSNCHIHWSRSPILGDGTASTRSTKSNRTA
jgi:hypothetical protein